MDEYKVTVKRNEQYVEIRLSWFYMYICRLFV
jgi:hypothetical protein